MGLLSLFGFGGGSKKTTSSSSSTTTTTSTRTLGFSEVQGPSVAATDSARVEFVDPGALAVAENIATTALELVGKQREAERAATERSVQQIASIARDASGIVDPSQLWKWAIGAGGAAAVALAFVASRKG